MTKRVVSDEELALVNIAHRVLPAGNFGNMAGDVVVREGRGGRIWDVSGNEYVDFLLSSGPMLLGHAHPEVNKAVIEQIERGSSFFANNEHAILLAAEIIAAVPCAEQLRFASTGTEADAYAMRLVRAFRKRSKILKFEGGFHGMSDYGLMSLWPAQSSNSTRAVPDTAGIPESVQGEMLVAPFNDLAATTEIIHAHHDELAGIIIEPLQRLVPPIPGFLQGLRDLATEYGIPLIFDEVVTGFRLAYGGAQEYYGVTPDVCTLGKVIGGGYALSAITGRAEIMAHFDRELVGASEFMPQMGTLSGNPIAAIAGLAALQVLKRPGAYETIFANGRAVWMGLETSLRDAGIPALILGEPPMFDAMFTNRKSIIDYRGTLEVDQATSRRFHLAARANGVFKNEGKLYISLAHDADDIETATVAFAAAARIICDA